MIAAVGKSIAPNRPSRTRAGSQPAANPPTIAPAAVAISSNMPSRMFAVPRSTFSLATALDVAITETMLVATA